MRSLILLGALRPHLTTLSIACIRCDRRATFSVADLLVQHGPQKPVAEVMAELSNGCPQQDAPTLGKECDVRSLDLLKLLEP
jgi:hypothetical protein